MPISFKTVFLILSLTGLVVGSITETSSRGGTVDIDRSSKILDRDNLDSINFENYITNLYYEIGLDQKDLKQDAFRYAMLGFYNLKSKRILKDEETLTIIDFEKSANTDRFYVLDLKERKLMHHTLVAHGKNTGGEYAQNFSNINQSYQSSLGFYVTKHTYEGKHGFSLRLEGWDGQFNSNAFDRAIVMHGANYVSKKYARENGRISRSLGCPAIPFGTHIPVINRIKNRSCLFAYYPDQNYLANSDRLDVNGAIESFLADYPS